MDRFWVYIGGAGRYNEAAVDMLNKALAIKNVERSDDDTQVAVKLHELGVRLQENIRYDKARMLMKGLRIEKAEPAKEVLQVAIMLQSLGIYLRGRGYLEEGSGNGECYRGRGRSPGSHHTA